MENGQNWTYTTWNQETIDDWEFSKGPKIEHFIGPNTVIKKKDGTEEFGLLNYPTSM